MESPGEAEQKAGERIRVCVTESEEQKHQTCTMNLMGLNVHCKEWRWSSGETKWNEVGHNSEECAQPTDEKRRAEIARKLCKEYSRIVDKIC